MARYYAARGIEMIHFHIDGDGFGLSDFEEIYPWVEGVTFVLSSDINDHQELFNQYSGRVDGLGLLDRDGDDLVLSVGDKTIRLSIDIANKNAQGLIIQDYSTLDKSSINQDYLAFYSPTELEPGIADYETMDEILDLLES